MGITVSNIVEAAIRDRCETVTRALNQYDYGQVLYISGVELPEAYEVHFSNTSIGSATTSIGNDVGVAIPDMYLVTGKDVHAWIYLHAGEEDGETLYHIRIPVIRRAKPTDQDPTPVQQDVITQTIAALNVAVLNARESASEASGYADDAADHVQEAAEQAEAAKGYADNAAESADKAEQAAGQAGYMFFHIDDNGHIIYTRTNNVDVDFSLDDGHLYVEVAS